MSAQGMVGGGGPGNTQNPGQNLMGLQTPALVAQLQRNMPNQQSMMGGGQQQQQYSHQSQQYGNT